MTRFQLILPLAILLLASGCGRDEAMATGAPKAHAHAHVAPQGGVLAELGNEEYHLELRHGDTPGVLQAFVMDGEAENFVRVAAASFQALGRSGSTEIPLVFNAVASSATGEKVGDTATFEAVTGLAGQPAIAVTIPEIAVKSRAYRNVTATLPARKP